MKTLPPIKVLLALALITLFSGCGAAFKYTPSHTGSYGKSASSGSVEILKGTDVRKGREKNGIKWNKPVQSIVANALEDELRYAGLYSSVQQGGTTPSGNGRSIDIQVHCLQLENVKTGGEIAGDVMLGFLGVTGGLISAAIPTKWVSNAEVDFAVSDAGGTQSVFQRRYKATRSVSLNGYKGMSQQFRQTSEVLEDLVKQFVSDLAGQSSGKSTGKNTKGR